MKKNFALILLVNLLLSGGYVLSNAGQEYASLSPAQTAAPAAAAQGMESFKERISLDLKDIEIRDAFKFLSEKININIVPTSQVNGRVTLMLKNALPSDIFEILIRSNALAYEKIGDIYNVMTMKEYKERYGKEFGDVRQVRVFHLQYVIPEQAFNIIDSLKSSLGKVLVESDSGTILVMDTPDKIKEISKTIDALERKSTIQVFNLRYAKAEEVAKQLKTQLDMKKVGSIKDDARTNQVIVQTLPERMKDIERIITELDQKTREVLIDARIIQVKLTNNLSAGVEWEGLFKLSTKHGINYLGSYPFSSVATSNEDWRSRQQVYEDNNKNIGSYPFSGTTSDFSSGKKRVGTEEMHVGVIGKNDYDVLIKYLTTLGDVRILSNPKLAVTNNQEARIHVGERQAYITTTTTAGQTTTTVAEQVTFMDIGLQLYITPTINDEGYVTLRIKPEVSSVVGTLVTSQNNRIPILDTSTTETTVMIKDGATLIVGGLRKEDQSEDTKRVPILGKIPLLGVLFRSETKQKSRSELLVMVTAHILSGDNLTTGYAKDLDKKLDKEYQDYAPMTKESDLTAHEKEAGTSEEKIYQEYPEVKVKDEPIPAIKPLKDN